MAIHRRFFFLLVSLLPLQLGFHMWPVWAHILGRRVDYLSPTIFITDIIIVMMLISWVVSRRRDTYSFFPPVYKSYVAIGSGIMLFIIINIFTATSPEVAVYKWIKVLEFAALSWYIVRTRVKVDDLILPLSISIVGTSLLAIVQLAWQHSVGGIFWWLGERTLSLDTPGAARFNLCLWSRDVCRLILRPYATFPHPNVLGGFIAVTIPLLISQWYRGGSKNMRWVYMSVLILGMIALLISLSRGAWFVGILLGVCTLYVFAYTGVHVKFVSVITRLIVPSLVIIFFSITLIFFFPSVVDESIVRRQELNSAAITMWQNSPIIGVGLGNYLVDLPHVSAARPGNYLQPVHNIYLLLLTELGLVGALGLFLVMGIGARKFISSIYLLSAADRKMAVLPLLSVVGLLHLGLIDHYPITLQQGQLITVIFFSLIFSRFR